MIFEVKVKLKVAKFKCFSSLAAGRCMHRRLGVEIRRVTKFQTQLLFYTSIHFTRAGGRTPRTPRPGGGGPHVCSGASCYVENFFLVFYVFKIFVKIFVHNEIY